MIQFATFFFILLILDLTWITVRKNYYFNFYNSVQGTDLKINYKYAFLSYLVIAFTLWNFIIKKKGSITDAMILGACLYAVYDLTNQATLSRWTLEMTITDVIWGAILSGVSVYIYLRLTGSLYPS
jgi:uncharacterized membrane protein